MAIPCSGRLSPQSSLHLSLREVLFMFKSGNSLRHSARLPRNSGKKVSDGRRSAIMSIITERG